MCYPFLCHTFPFHRYLPFVFISYVYWTMHHLDSCIKRHQLDVTCFIISLFNAQHVSDVNTSILRSLRLICWVISCIVLLWFDVCWCYVVVCLGWCGIRMQAEALLQPASGYHTTWPHVSSVKRSSSGQLRTMLLTLNEVIPLCTDSIYSLY